MKKDIGVLGKGKSDPYAIINVGAQEFRTQTIDNNVNPKWDYWCEVSSPFTQKLNPFALLCYFVYFLDFFYSQLCMDSIFYHFEF